MPVNHKLDSTRRLRRVAERRTTLSISSKPLHSICLRAVVLSQSTSMRSLSSGRLYINRIALLGINPIRVHWDRALIRRAIVYAFPSVLISSTVHSRQADSGFERIAGVVCTFGSCSPRIAACSDDYRRTALAAGIRAAFAAVLKEVAQGGDGGGEAADACFDVGA
jgi:hypothetical protein